MTEIEYVELTRILKNIHDSVMRKDDDDEELDDDDDLDDWDDDDWDAIS